ncbi:MAG: Gfo/Idh/MocA family oxidoreductase [Rhizobiales bacterium]|nr:Gfo/Idh/MocA family oxidoreductase [Hyphomicrobiales bacterium]MBO6698806.1 Gfo/Idh/MocA family oxidoreductase [Hyphomicrobiales bacterium]MBO6734941.1 Gfo/Idh/MocA family oxidoreductase [Hyphomicrobiales bacterium]MBO6911253.1 Gfo/Idh/MocA family oxidoreductase [Hyphomicrobiales bacterium]MBO6955743.1 Gfo/Idh/MocA family oxidoreductase [Hyphomicrobiales bacterium]
MTARIGLVGAGWWATFNHIPTVQKSPVADLIAICDLDADRIDQVGETFDIASRYTDLAAMLRQENLDGLIVSTPHVAHREPAVMGLEAGCHVLVEKPMATTADDGWAIAQAARRAGKEVLVPTGMNFEWFSIKASQWVRDGRIGEVRHAACQMGSALSDLFAGEPMLETTDHMYRPPASTWADPQRAGGYGWGQLSHALAWLFYVSDLKAANAYCMVGRSPTGVDFYDAACARATNGATIALSGSSTVPKHVGMYMDIKIFGSEGMIDFNNAEARLALYRDDEADEVVAMSAEDGEYDGALPVEIFAKLCAGETVENASNGENGARVTELLHALYRSAETDSLITIGS